MFIKRANIEKLRREYPVGCRVELVRMDDTQAPPIGTKGTVRGVDDIGSIMVSWDNGSSLSVVYGEDMVRKLNSVTVICYRQKKVWDSRKDAMKFYLEAMTSTEGSEHDRYAKILAELMSGEITCTDEEDEDCDQ